MSTQQDTSWHQKFAANAIDYPIESSVAIDFLTGRRITIPLADQSRTTLSEV